MIPIPVQSPQPWATWHYGFNHLSAGDILYIRGGTYTGVVGGSSNKFGVRVEGKNGTSASHIKISAYQGETPVLDCSSLNSVTGQNVGIAIYNSSYIDITGLNVINCTQHAVNYFASPGFYEDGVSHITHTLCTIRHCGTGFTLNGTYDYVYYTNCDAYELADTYDDPGNALPGSLANGFYSAPRAGKHVYLKGCRAWNCSDDGFDIFGGNGYVEYTNCWAFNNGHCPAGGPIAETYGDGSGFKLGPSTGPIESGFQITLKNCLAVGNLGLGFDQNATSTSTNVRHALYNCVAANNTGTGFQYYWDHISAFKNNISYNNKVNYEFGSGSTIDHNSWQNGLVASAADFISTNATELANPRKSDGSLPDINFLHLATGSDLIDKGISVGLPFSGIAPDLGAFELQAASNPPPTGGSQAQITMTISPSPVHKMINILFLYASTFNINDPASSPQIVRILDVSGKLFIEKLLVTGVTSTKFSLNIASGIYTVMVLSGGINMSSQLMVVH